MLELEVPSAIVTVAVAVFPFKYDIHDAES